jgi:hypothetical protein
MFDWLFRPFRRRERPMAQDDIYTQLVWLEPNQNPFYLRVAG